MRYRRHPKRLTAIGRGDFRQGHSGADVCHFRNMRRCTPVFPATQTDVGESPASLSTPAIGSGLRSALTQPMGRFAESPGQRFDGAMKIIQHADCFEVRSEDGSIVRQFAFDDNARRRAFSRRMTRKQAYQAARTFAGKIYTVETAEPCTD